MQANHPNRDITSSSQSLDKGPKVRNLNTNMKNADNIEELTET